jgi:nucleoside-diphosphate-sugar epimerase
MKILLTGATGFIGSHVARELLNRNHEVHCTVRPTSNRYRINGIEDQVHIWSGDVGGNVDFMPIEPDIVINMAWHADPANYLTAPENKKCLDVSRRLLKQLKCRSVFIGTCFEYNTKLGVLHENSETQPLTLYSETKDALRRDVEQKENAVWARLFYQYGPHEDIRRFVPSVISRLMSGTVIETSSCKQRRDYLYVEDVASAICNIAESKLVGCVNVGSGNAVSMREIMDTIGSLTGTSDLIKYGVIPDKDEPQLICADNTKLRSTGWVQKWSLVDGLRELCR